MNIERSEDGSRKVKMSHMYKGGERVSCILRSAQSKSGDKKFREVSAKIVSMRE
jgi:hypothetical protein